MMDKIMLLVPAVALLALLFAAFTAKSILKMDPGSEDVKRISAIVRKGANAFLKKQYKTVIIFFGIVFILLLILTAIAKTVHGGALAQSVYWETPFAFLSGGIFSGLSGFLGMKIATVSNCRTVVSAKNSLNAGLRTAFKSGLVMGLVVVGLGMLDTGIWYCILRFGCGYTEAAQIAPIMLTFGMGASSMALFARVGGGIFTKAADVGADLVGKVEVGIPEDDPRNPAVIADNVGDNVGDVAGMGADLYESYIGAVISAAALGVFAFNSMNAFALPFLLAAAGILASIIGSFFVRTGDSTDQKKLLGALRKGTYIAAVLMVIASFFIIWAVMGNTAPANNSNFNFWYLFIAMLSGLAGGIAIGYFTEYYTSASYKPTQRLSASGKTGPATVIIDGLSLGMLSTLIPVLIVGAVIFLSYFITAGFQWSNVEMGLFGVGIAAVGMLSTLGITLATDAYGPVADNAGGIAEMTHQPEFVRERTDALDSLGNTTAATGKGFAIGSAALTAITLLSAFAHTIKTLASQLAPDTFTFGISLLDPRVLIGLFIGVVLPFVFSAVTMSAVGKAAEKVVIEVRRQFREIKGIMEGTTEPDYERCVSICTGASQKYMIIPGIIAIAAPILTALLLGFAAVVAMLSGAAASGFVLAIMMANSGGAWDNAKKYVETGEHGGKGSEAHKAAVVGDTVGDPFKDTSGPSINILIKLLSTISIVFAPFLALIPWIWN